MEIGLVRKVDIDNEMQQSYMDYAMSVIVSRALPDARDGLKPVQRRILYAMYDMGLRPNTPHRKSARIVGEVLGKYHPHGDSSVYEAMARLAQDFTIRYPLVDGQGNFGSVDGDPPAAMRYTEARLMSFATELISQIDRDTVRFVRNFDDSLDEPEVLPAALPNLLVNGSNGIAVGMATSIPPHNLGEVVDALSFLLENWDQVDDIAIGDLMEFIKGPDFPTGGIIMEAEDSHEMLSAYGSGRGRFKVRGRVHIEEMERGRSRIIITEIPYLVNKTNLLEKIADLARTEAIEGITDLRDESDRHGMRIVLELGKNTDVDKVLRDLYQRTPLQNTFSLSLLALVKGEPRLLSLKQALLVYLEHRIEVIRRRSEYDLRKAEERAHILDGLLVALKNLDEVIALIRKSPDVETARERLIKKYKLSQVQAQAILDMQLRRLAALERKKIEAEYKELQQKIKELKALLHSPKKIREEVEKELVEMKSLYADNRRTQIVSLKEGESAQDLLTVQDITPAVDIWVGVTKEGLIGRTREDKLNRVSGRDAPRWLLRVNSHHTIYLVSENGKAAAVSMEVLPEVESFSDGTHFSKVSPLSEEDKLAAIFSIPPQSQIEGEHYILTVTESGMVKKSSLEELSGPSSKPILLTKVSPGDYLMRAFITDGQSEILMASARGMAIRFSESDVRSMGLGSAGVNGIKLKEEDWVTVAEKVVPDSEVLFMGSNGTAWRLSENSFPLQGRYGQGIIISKLPDDVTIVGGMVGKKTQSGLAHFDKAASRIIRVDLVELGKRLRVGKDALPVKEGDAVVEVTSMEDGLAYWSEQQSKSGSKKKRSAKG